MRYRILGSTGLRVSELALGTGTFGTGWGWGSSRDESRAVFDAFGEAGGNLLDCADIYQGGESEAILGELIAGDRDRWIVTTKYTGAGASDIAKSGNNRKHMLASVDASLRRLGTDYIDVLFPHFWDGVTPPEELLQGFDALVGSGKVRYVGLSDFPAWYAARTVTLAQARGLIAPSVLQLEYSLVERTIEHEQLPLASHLDLAVLAWSPLAGGTLTGKYRTGDQGRQSSGGGPVHVEDARMTPILNVVQTIAEARDVSPAQVALSWVRRRPVIPILGARTLGQLQDNLGALQVHLEDAELEALDTASAPPDCFPAGMLRSARMADMASGGHGAEIDLAPR